MVPFDTKAILALAAAGLLAPPAVQAQAVEQIEQRQLRHQVELLHIVLRMQRCCSQSRWIRCGSCCGLQQMAFAAAALAP